MTAAKMLVQSGVFETEEIGPDNLIYCRDNYISLQKYINRAMVEFAQYHCKQQLEDILMSVEIITDRDITTQGLVVKITVNNDSIINAYPLDRIK